MLIQIFAIEIEYSLAYWFLTFTHVSYFADYEWLTGEKIQTADN